jgi:hypothetical protein
VQQLVEPLLGAVAALQSSHFCDSSFVLVQVGEVLQTLPGGGLEKVEIEF